MWEFAGTSLEGREHIHGLLSECPNLPAATEKEAWQTLADLGWQAGAVTLAESSLRRGVEEDPKSLALIARITHSLGDYEGATAVARAAIRKAEEVGDLDVLARAWSVVGHSATGKHQWAQAWTAYEQSLEAARRLGDPVRLAASMLNLGNIARLTAEFDLSRSLLEEANRLAKDAGHLVLRGSIAVDRASLEVECGRPHAAGPIVLEQLDGGSSTSTRRLLLFTVAGHALLAVGDAEHGARLIIYALGERRRSGAGRQNLEREAYEGYVAKAKSLLGEDGFARAARRGRLLDGRRAYALCKERLALLSEGMAYS